MNTPRHIAIIMDGNGRWAKARRHHRVFGHLRGARVAKNIIEESVRLKIAHLTLFAFSTENWFRPEDEVNFLMRLLVRNLQREKATLIKNNVRFLAIGDLDRLPKPVREVVAQVAEATEGNNGMQLTFALSYGSRQELTQTTKDLVRRARLGELHEDEVDEALIAQTLPSSFLPDPDLIIRTSGESRLSNFMLWQAAYSEIIFSQKSWPEFSLADFNQALHDFALTERRFGRTSEQIQRTTSLQN